MPTTVGRLAMDLEELARLIAHQRSRGRQSAVERGDVPGGGGASARIVAGSAVLQGAGAVAASHHPS